MWPSESGWEESLVGSEMIHFRFPGTIAWPGKFSASVSIMERTLRLAPRFVLLWTCQMPGFVWLSWKPHVHLFNHQLVSQHGVSGPGLSSRSCWSDSELRCHDFSVCPFRAGKSWCNTATHEQSCSPAGLLRGCSAQWVDGPSYRFWRRATWDLWRIRGHRSF